MLLANLLAVALAIPLILLIGLVAFGTRSLSLIPLGVTFLVGVLPNPCAAGLQSVCHALATDGDVSARLHWAGLRRYAKLATASWLFALLVSILIIANAAFYAYCLGNATGVLHTIALPLFLVWIFLLGGWVSIHVFVFPLLIEQEVKSVRLVYRNAALMAIARPAVVAVVVPAWILVLLVSSTTGLATFIGLAFAAAIQHSTTARLLPTFPLGPPS